MSSREFTPAVSVLELPAIFVEKQNFALFWMKMQIFPSKKQVSLTQYFQIHDATSLAETFQREKLKHSTCARFTIVTILAHSKYESFVWTYPKVYMIQQNI